MPILRQYSLPNCILIVEGMGTAADASQARPELSVVTKVECHFAREKQPLIGGIDLLEQLIQATNDCVQTWISGLQSKSVSRKSEESAISLEVHGNDRFALTVPTALLFAPVVSDKGTNGNGSTAITLELSALQLFDLMEAIDQLGADQQTLPALNTAVRPRTRRAVKTGTDAIQQTAPIAIGLSSVAVAAAALFFVPIPKPPTPAEDPSPSTEPTMVQPSGNVPAAPPLQETGLGVVAPVPGASPPATAQPGSTAPEASNEESN